MQNIIVLGNRNSKHKQLELHMCMFAPVPLLMKMKRLSGKRGKGGGHLRTKGEKDGMLYQRKKKTGEEDNVYRETKKPTLK